MIIICGRLVNKHERIGIVEFFPINWYKNKKKRPSHEYDEEEEESESIMKKIDPHNDTKI